DILGRCSLPYAARTARRIADADMPSRPLLLINCGQLLTLSGPPRPRRGLEMEALGLIRRGAVLIENGRVARVGRETEVLRSSPAARRAHRLDAGGRVVMPGFVDSHTHALFTG